jgi:hypothetical protein
MKGLVGKCAVVKYADRIRAELDPAPGSRA